MDPGPESHTEPQVPLPYEQQQFLNLMLEWHHQHDADTPDDTNMPVQEGDQEGEEEEEESEESEAPYETDSGTDSNEDLHSGAEPFWIDVQAETYRGCADECPEGVVCEDFNVLIEAGHVDLPYGTNARVRIEQEYRR